MVRFPDWLTRLPAFMEADWLMGDYALRPPLMRLVELTGSPVVLLGLSNDDVPNNTAV